MSENGTVSVLVLGLGGTVNQGIVKALRASSLPVRISGACIAADSAGLYFCDTAYLSPPAADPAFYPWLVDVCRRDRVDVLLTGVDAILTTLAPVTQQLQRDGGAFLVTSSAEALAIAGDKLATARWLADRGFEAPRSVPSEDQAACAKLAADAGFPLFAKPRRSRGSHGVLRVDDLTDLEYARRRSDYVIQEYLGDAAEEYTAGCFSGRAGEVLGTIVMQRRLEAGSTSCGIVVERPEIAAAAAAIAAALGAVGPCNLQFRVQGGRPVCFDINLRFSSTTPMRTRLGFREVEAAVRSFGLGQPVEHLLRPQGGIAVRYWNEIYVAPAALEQLRTEGRLDAPSDFAVVEGIDAPRPE